MLGSTGPQSAWLKDISNGTDTNTHAFANTADTAILVRRADFTTTTRNRLLTFFGEVERQFAIPIQTINRDKKKLQQERNVERRQFYSSRIELPGGIGGSSETCGTSPS